MSFFMTLDLRTHLIFFIDCLLLSGREFGMIRYDFIKARGKIKSSWILTVRMEIKENQDESSNDF